MTLYPHICFIYVTRAFCCFVWDKDGISDSTAEQPHCGSPSKPALQVRINRVYQQIKFHCFHSFSLSKPPLSSRNFLPLHWLGKAFLLRNTAARSLPFPAFPDRPAKWTSLHSKATPCCPCLAEDPPPRTPSAQWFSFLHKMDKLGCEGSSRKGGSPKRPHKAKDPPQPCTRSLSSLTAGSTAEGGALARDLKAVRRGGGFGISRGRLNRYQGLHGNSTRDCTGTIWLRNEWEEARKDSSVPATFSTLGHKGPAQHWRSMLLFGN